MKRVAGLVFALLAWAPDLFACAVCFGDPKSPLTIGAKAGVFFMLGVIGFVLVSIFGVMLFWMRRAKLLELQDGESEGRSQDRVAESI